MPEVAAPADPVRALIVDDEPLARQSVRDLLAGDSDVVVVGECGDGRSAVREIARLRPTLVFLDVQMPEMDGFAVLRRLAKAETPRIIFVTAYDQYALRAFEAHALDYLLKPFSAARFRSAVDQAKADIRRDRWSRLGRRLADLVNELGPSPPVAEPAEPEPPAESPLNRLMVKSAGRVVFLKVDEIDWIEAADYYSQLHVGGKTHLIRQTMKSLAEQLDGERFRRVHRSAIVNLDRVRGLRTPVRGQYHVVLRDGTTLKLSRSRRAEIERLLARLPRPRRGARG